MKILSNFFGFRYSILAVILILSLSACLVSYPGYLSKSDKEGYSKYKNKGLKYSLIFPDNWFSEMTIGGLYNMKPSEKSEEGMSVTSHTIEQRMGDRYTNLFSFEDYKKYRLSQITEEQIGPRLKMSYMDTMLCGYKACEITYTFESTLEQTLLYRKEIFFLNDNRIFTLYFYASNEKYDNFIPFYTELKEHFIVFN